MPIRLILVGSPKMFSKSSIKNLTLLSLKSRGALHYICWEQDRDLYSNSMGKTLDDFGGAQVSTHEGQAPVEKVDSY